MPDSDSVYLFRDDMPLDQTLPLTLEDVALHRHTTINGCSEVNRDPLLSHEAEAILDPDGDKALARELRYGKPVVMRRCGCRLHRGRKDIPAAEFADGDDYCRPCRHALDYKARHGDARLDLVRAKQGWRRQMNADGRKGNARNFAKR